MNTPAKRIPLGRDAPIEVEIRELGNAVFPLRRITGETAELFHQFQATNDVRLLWRIAAVALDGIAEEQVQRLEMETVDKVLHLASAPLQEVYDLMGKGAGPEDTTGGSTSTTPSPTPSDASPAATA